MFEFIAFSAILINLFILNNIFDKLKKIDRTVEVQKNILDQIKISDTKALEHTPTNNSLALNQNQNTVVAKETKVPEQTHQEKVNQSTTLIAEHTFNAEIKDNTLIDKTKKTDELNILDRTINWIREGFLIKVGGLLLLLSGIWFLSIGFNNLDSNGRVIAGLFAGAGLIAVGFWQMNQRLILGQVLELLGSSIVLTSILSGRFNYNLGWLTPLIAFAGCVLIVGINTIIGILKNSRPIAFLSLILGYLAPFFAFGSEFSFVGLMIYVLIFNISMLFVSYYKKWNFLLLPNILFSTIYLTSYGLGDKDRVAVWVFAIIFMAVFYVATIFNQIKKTKLSGLDIFNSLFATLVGFGWINIFVDGDWKTIVVALYAILTFVIATALYRSKSPNEFVYLQLITAFVSLIYATVLLFGTQYDYTLVAVSLELTGAQFLVSSILNKKVSMQRIVGLLQLLPLFGSVLVLLFGISSWGNIFTTLILTLCAILNSIIFFDKFDGTKEVDFSYFAKLFGLIGFLMAIRWIWILFEKIFDVEQTRGLANILVTSNNENIKQTTLAHGSTLTVLTICAIMMISRVIKIHPKEQKFLGYTLIAFVLLRLVLVEITLMDTTFKIITFAAIGILLTLTAFIRKED